jgi:OmcA/MtrC family decaheme c-type cytochrome
VQKDAWLKPSRRACGSCHDDVNFATGENHADLPQVSDNQCSTCHTVQGELEFDISIKGAHTIATKSRELPGTTFELLSVADGAPGKKPTVSFSIKDKSGKPILPSEMTRPDRGSRSHRWGQQWGLLLDLQHRDSGHRDRFLYGLH